MQQAPSKVKFILIHHSAAYSPFTQYWQSLRWLLIQAAQLGGINWGAEVFKSVLNSYF